VSGCLFGGRLLNLEEKDGGGNACRNKTNTRVLSVIVARGWGKRGSGREGVSKEGLCKTLFAGERNLKGGTI